MIRIILLLIIFSLNFYSCSSNKPIFINIDNDPNAQYYGKYEFDVEIPSVVFPFEASLTIGTSKRGNITSRIIWSFQGQSFYNSVVRNLKITDAVISFNSKSSDGVSSDIQFYFTGENKIEGSVTTVDDPINGGIPGTVFYLIGQKVE
tara:strand:+ start:30 stop:473 length:444 start_codon:yes stop_codon:yes gene_type:complete